MAEAFSFEVVAARLTPPLRHYLAHFLDDAALAEDLLQETLLKISKGLPGFESRSSLETWAFSVATHTAIDHLRRSSMGSRIVAIEDADAVPGSLDDVDEPLIVDEMSSCVREEIESLPGDYRAALVLHDLEGKTAQQTAEICGCSLATAKIRIHRARARLKQALERDCDFYHDRRQVLRCDRKGAGADDTRA
jgi:RNA polymerase sigma-70 factor (ECF subfamily)